MFVLVARNTEADQVLQPGVGPFLTIELVMNLQNPATTLAFAALQLIPF